MVNQANSTSHTISTSSIFQYVTGNFQVTVIFNLELSLVNIIIETVQEERHDATDNQAPGIVSALSKTTGEIEKL